MMTLEDYLRDNLSRGIIDHSIRADVSSGYVSFYIHPSGKDGDTLDFWVKDNYLLSRHQVKDGITYIESRPGVV